MTDENVDDIIINYTNNTCRTNRHTATTDQTYIIYLCPSVKKAPFPKLTSK